MKQHRQPALAVPSLSTPAWAPESLDGGFGNSWMAEQLGAGSLAVDPAGLIRRATAAFGVELGGTQVVAGAQGAEVAASEGAAATTLGDTVFVGAEVAGLDAATQSWVLMHELAHVAQQQAGGSGADVEADADRMADAAIAGGQSLPTASAAPTQHHHLDLEEVVGAGMDVVEAGVGVVEGAVEAGAELIGGGVDLVQQLVSGALTPDLLATLSPGELAAGLAQSQPPTIASVIGGIPAGYEALAVAALTLLGGPLATAVLFGLAPDALTRLYTAAPESLGSLLRAALDRTMPAGVGVGFAVDGAATFALPVKAGLGGSLEVIHRGGGAFDLAVSGEALGGLDTGVGAGASIGLDGGAIGVGELGLGAEVGAEAGAGLKTILESQYAIDVFSGQQDPGSIVALMLAGDATALADDVTRLALALGVGSFHRSTSFRTETYADASGNGDAGLRTGDASTRPSFETGEDGDANAGNISWWQEFTRFFMNIGLNFNGGMTATFETPEWATDEDGVLLPVDATMSLACSAELMAEASQSLPMLVEPPSDVGAGVSLGVTYDVVSAGETKFDLLNPAWTYGASASYDGNSVEISSTQEDIVDDDASFAEHLAALGDVSLSWEAGIGAPIVERFVGRAMAEQGLDTTLGLTGTVATSTTIAADTVRAAITAAVGNEPDPKLGDAIWAGAQRFLITAKADGLKQALSTSGAGEAWDLLVAGAIDGSEGTNVRLEAALGVSGEATLSEGAKVEGEGSAAGKLIYDSTFGDGPDAPETSALLQGLWADGPNTLQN